MFGDMGNTLGGPYVKRCDALMAEINLHNAIDVSFPQGDRVAMEGPADHDVAVAVTDLPVMLDLPDEGSRAVIDGLRLLREGPAAAAVPRGRDLQLQRVVGALVIVDLPPVVEAQLAVHQVPERLAAQHLVLEGPVEALVLAQGLRVIGPAVDHGDPQADQPGRKAGVEVSIVAPGRPVVHEHGPRQPVAPKELDEQRPDRVGPLVRAGLQAYGEP